MSKYRKKPVIIDAVQFNLNNIKIKKNDDYEYNYGLQYDKSSDLFYIITLEGKLYVNDKDYIITGVKGERYAYKPDIFELTYEKVKDE